ncbi:MAG TPA: hypothetical protein VG602_06470 [Actinomycetota bacterium]|nr:hypothetical protein [Actinomycetota bacterium]
MDRFVPVEDDCLEMTRHLRPVPTTPSDGPTYVVDRSEYARPGTPYVVALCVDHQVAETMALSGHETYLAHEMREDPGLAQALKDWDDGDDELLNAERSARVAFTRSERAQLFRKVPAQHPSVLSKLQQI